MDKVISELSSLNVTFEMRRLSVGDFAWICRDKMERELMLPYILERKRLDDLSGSITDGRFHEQKVNIYDENIMSVINTYGNLYAYSLD